MSELLDGDAVRNELHPFYTELQVVAETGSTNDDVIAAARAGAEAGLVRVAEFQTAGRGRLSRAWEAPAGSSLMFSLLVRPTVTAARWGWIPLLAGLGVRDAIAAAGAEVVLKWPNDVQLGAAREKCGGILTQAVQDAVVIGIGLNVLDHADLPPEATAIGPVWPASREQILTAVLNAIAVRYEQWNNADGDVESSGLLDDYRAACGTLGEQVRVFLPGGEDPVEGLGEHVDEHGRLVVRTETGRLVVGAGDVVHIRAAV